MIYIGQGLNMEFWEHISGLNNIKTMPCLESDRSDCQPETNSLARSQRLRAVVVPSKDMTKEASYPTFTFFRKSPCSGLNILKNVEALFCKQYHNANLIHSTLKGTGLQYFPLPPPPPRKISRISFTSSRQIELETRHF